jgi:hypothetical protein
MSGAPEDSNPNLPPSGISRGTRAIIHRTVRCTPDSVRGSKGKPPQELASLRKSLQPLHYNSPDCPVYTGLSGATAEQRLFRRQRLPTTHLMRAQRAQRSGAPILAHRTMNKRCPVCTGHPGGPRSQELQRSESNGTGDVAGAINTPTTPPFIASKFSTSQPLTRARHSILDTYKEIKSSPISLKALVISERDLPCSFELLRLDCFFSFSLVLVIKTPL